MKKRHFVLFLLLSTILSSCYTTEPTIKKYIPTPLYANVDYMPKPVSFDSVRVVNYISGGYIQGNDASDSEKANDILNLAQLAFNRAHRFKNFNLAYGVDAFAGSYVDNTLSSWDPGDFGKKNVSGFQLKTSLNHYRSYSKFELRIIGLDLKYSNEYGDFPKHRKAVLGTENIYVIPRTGLFSAGLSSEIILKASEFSKIDQIGLRLGGRHTFGDLRFRGFDEDGNSGGKLSAITPSAAFYLQQRRYFFILEGGGISARINIGYRL